MLLLEVVQKRLDFYQVELVAVLIIRSTNSGDPSVTVVTWVFLGG